VPIAEVLLLDDEIVFKHVNEYRKAHKFHIKNNGSLSKLNIKQSEELIKHLALKTYVKVEDICVYVLFYYKISYTISGMTDWLHSHKFSYKKLIDCFPSN
jgi:transposase